MQICLMKASQSTNGRLDKRRVELELEISGKRNAVEAEASLRTEKKVKVKVEEEEKINGQLDSKNLAKNMKSEEEKNRMAKADLSTTGLQVQHQDHALTYCGEKQVGPVPTGQWAGSLCRVPENIARLKQQKHMQIVPISTLS